MSYETLHGRRTLRSLYLLSFRFHTMCACSFADGTFHYFTLINPRCQHDYILRSGSSPSESPNLAVVLGTLIQFPYFINK